MGRPKLPGARRAHVSARFSDHELWLMDRKRGELGRSAWLRRLAIDALMPDAPPAPPAGPPSRHDVARAALASVTYLDPEPSGEPCRHPAASVEAGTCRECGADVF